MATARQLEQPGTNLYEQDFLAWTMSQAEALRARQAVALDWAMIKARPPCVEGVTKPFIGAFSAFLGLLCQNLSCPKKGDFVNKRNARTTKYISACILLLLGSASAWAGASPANTGEIVISHVSDLGKVVTMRGEVEGDKANGFEFLVPGKQFDVKCNSYPYGYPKNPYNHIKKTGYIFYKSQRLLQSRQNQGLQVHLAMSYVRPLHLGVSRNKQRRNTLVSIVFRST
jgi:hypothetical protein